MRTAAMPRLLLVCLAVACPWATACVAAEIDHAAVERAKRAFVERMLGRHDFTRAELENALADVEISPGILETIARPAERVVPWYEYREIFLTPERIAAGAQFWHTHEGRIAEASERYGVAPEILVAVLGVETYFGRRMGSHRVLDALATLAFAYPPRAEFFASELESFLLLSREEGVGLFDALGSYAGAMGAGQFIPSSFRAYAVDANGDGRRDLWEDWEDILASVANYFKVHGWRPSEPVAAAASLTEEWAGHVPDNRLELDHTVGDLKRRGYLFPAALPDSAPAMVLALEADADSSEYWIGYHNFFVITRYNRSPKYALAVHQLGREILAAYRAAGPEIEAP